jgi:hypothetical protein
MRLPSSALLILLCLGSLCPSSVLAAPIADFQPDPLSVQRHGPAYRYPQAGWIVLHIEGEPYERGYQHGRLLAPEIARYLRCFAALQNPKAPSDGWKQTRTLVNALFLRRFEKEYLEEMKGIADGATAAGGRFDDRPIDLVDVAALNCWAEVETLESALEATPTGLEGLRFPHRQPRALPLPKPSHCSAFAATGPATADGKIVFGHITMFSLYPALFYNVWLDIKPAKGHRILMQTYPGGIQSGMDYYLNDAGLLVCETTIGQTRFAIDGMSLTSRIRRALQYADNIDRAVEMLTKDNNGLYSNEWLLADIKTNEIAMFELGTHKTRLWRSSKGEWFGNTPGFYWGCNNAKDLQVRLETVASVKGRPANVVWRPSDRDKKWLALYEQHKGKIDAGFGKLAFTTPPLAAYHSLDAKVTTTDLAKELKTWALFGPPLGRSWQPTQDERSKYPDIRPLASNPWTVLHPGAPPKVTPSGPLVVDLSDKVDSADEASAKLAEDKPLPTEAAWHGTLLPKTDADIWLAAAFAEYEKIVSRENSVREASNGKLAAADRDRLAVNLFAHRSRYLAAARVIGDVPLSKTRSDPRQDEWYRLAAGKGVLLLNELREWLGPTTFEEVMDTFGQRHAGKEVASAEFQAHLQKKVGERLHPGFFDYWLQTPGLPMIRLGQVTVVPDGEAFKVEAEIIVENPPPRGQLEVTVETSNGEVTRRVPYNVPFAGARGNGDGKGLVEVKPSSVLTTHLSIETKARPQRLIVDRYGLAAKANGGVFSVLSFHHELEQCLIVYGTADEEASNREAAEKLQRAIRERHSNYTVPLKSDRNVTDADLKGHHLLLIGRPDSNSLVERFKSALPIAFGSRSFVVRSKAYAHPDSAVIAATENPMNKRYSLVVLAGLSAASTLNAPAALLREGQATGEVLVLPHDAKPQALVLPARELVRELREQ